MLDFFFSLQLKQSVIGSNKHGMCELSHKLSSEFKLRILKNQEISEKSQNCLELYPRCITFPKPKFCKTSKKLLKKRN